MRILVLGKGGQVGFELTNRLVGLGELISCGREQVNLSDPDSIRRGVRDAEPDVIVNAAAYTAVDLAEDEPGLAMAINGLAPGVLAEEAKRCGALLVHYSTDYVFDGMNASPYAEEDPTRPLNSYGRSKLAGEQAIQAVAPHHIVLRTSWVYGARGKNFMLTMLKLARERDELRVVSDQRGTPTSSRSVAMATRKILECLGSGAEFRAEAARTSGLYHLTDLGETSWFGFASAIFENALRSGAVSPAFRLARVPALKAIRTDEYPTITPRPLYTVLSSEKVRRVFGLSIPTWESSLADVMRG